MKNKEQLSFWTQVQTQIRTQTKNPGSKTAFEFGPNLLGIPIGLEFFWQIPQNSYLPCPSRL
jgi:hypothetical protein